MSEFESKVDDVRKAYESGAYEAALALALTLPDICAAIEYPEIKLVGKRYISWSNKHIFNDSTLDDDVKFAGEALYQLRCNYLHSGTSNIYKDTGDADARVFIDKFELMLPKLNDDGLGELCMIKKVYKDDQTQDEIYVVEMNIGYIIDEICCAVLEFYESSNNKYEFEDHSVKILKYHK